MPYVVAAFVLAAFVDFPPHHYFIFIGLAWLSRGLKRRWLAGAIGAALLLIYLLLTGFSEHSHPRLVSDAPVGVYNELWSQFRQGKLHLPGVPDPRLAALQNPYDIAQRAGIHYNWDQSYYKGRYYIYWGIGPVLTLNAPFNLLTGRYLTELAQGIWFCFWAVIFCFVVTYRLIRRYSGRDPSLDTCFWIGAAILFCCEWSSSVRRMAIYEIPILASTAYLFAGYSILLARDGGRRWSGWAGLLLGLAVACRPTAMLGFAVLPAFLPWRQMPGLLKGLVPAGLLVAAYNVARFDSPFEFGFHYQMCQFDMRTWSIQSQNLIYAGLGFLLQPPTSLPVFPFVKTWFFGEGWLLFRHSYLNEDVLGLLPSAPFVLLIWPALRKSGNPAWTRSAGLFLVSGFLILLMASAAGATRRYASEFFPFFVITALVSVFVLEKQRWGKVGSVVVAAALLYSLNVGAFAGVWVHQSAFHRHYPAAFNALSAFYGRTGGPSR